MRNRRRWVAGVLAALLLLPVPAFAIQKSVARASVHGKIHKYSSTSLIQHENFERHEYIAFQRAIRSLYRGSDSTTRATVNRFLKNVFLNLRQHWRQESQTGELSPFTFPSI